MIVNDMSIIDIRDNTLDARTYFADNAIQEIKVKYVEHHELRDLIRKFVHTVIEEYHKTLFVHVCGSCGNCCSDAERLVTAAEAHKIALFLDLMTDEELRKQYLQPAATWNRNDGLLSFYGGSCVFLNPCRSGTMHCRIYPVRPFACASIQPSMERCRKAPEKLLMNVERMVLQGDTLEVFFTDRSPEKLELYSNDLKEQVEKIIGYLSNLPVDKQDRVDYIASEAERIIGELFEDFYRQGADDKLTERVDGIAEVVASLDNLTSMGREKPELLEHLWKKINDLRRLMENKLPPPSAVISPDTCEKRESPDYGISAMRLLSESLYAMKERNGVIEQRIFLFRVYPVLLEPVRAFLKALISIDETQIRVALKQGEPQCTLCGACCRNYSVEVSPLDIDRLADYFDIDRDEVCATYLVPGRFSWNYGDYIIKWADNPGSRKDCIFIRKKSEQLYYCSIYEGRPQVCRDYTARNRLCEKTNFTSNIELYPSNIISIDIFDGYLYLATYYTHQAQVPPLVLRLADFDTLNEAYRMLAKGLDDLRASLSKPEHSLISGDGSPHVP